MTKALIGFTPGHHDKQKEAMSRYNAKLDALRNVLVDRGSCDSKEVLETIAENISAAFDKIKLNESYTDPSRGQMIEYVQQAIREGYSSYYGLPINGICWLSDDCLKVDHGAAWEYYNLSADEKGKPPQRGLGE